MSIPFRLEIPRRLYEALVAQARTELPNECCGLLAGTIDSQGVKPGQPAVGRVVERYPLVNATASPTRYESEPRSMFEAIRDMRRRGIDVLAVYHSHPTTAPVPSRTDLQRNYSPDVMNLIVSLQNGEARMAAWWLAEHDYRAAEWVMGGG